MSLIHFNYSDNWSLILNEKYMHLDLIPKLYHELIKHLNTLKYKYIHKSNLFNDYDRLKISIIISKNNIWKILNLLIFLGFEIDIYKIYHKYQKCV